jgi:hypothetical protein
MPLKKLMHKKCSELEWDDITSCCVVDWGRN